MYPLLGSGLYLLGKQVQLLSVGETSNLFPRQVWLTTENVRYRHGMRVKHEVECKVMEEWYTKRNISGPTDI